MTETVYLKIPQITEVHSSEVCLGDIARVHCRDPKAEAKVRAVKVVSFSETEGRRGADRGLLGRRLFGQRDTVYIGNVMDLMEKIERSDENIRISCLGEADFIVKYKTARPFPRLWEWLKTAFVSVVAFCGAAFAIMTFNNDAGVTDVFACLYRQVTGTAPAGVTVLEASYSVGLALGILIFFNHFASWKITVDPTPIEVEMRLYEENVNRTLIANSARKETGVDVS